MPDEKPTMAIAAAQAELLPNSFALKVTLDVAGGLIRFEWSRIGTGETVARGRLIPASESLFGRFRTLDWFMEPTGKKSHDFCGVSPPSTRALTKRIRKLFPVAENGVHVGVLSDINLGNAKAEQWFSLELPVTDFWRWLEPQIRALARLNLSALESQNGTIKNSRDMMHLLACAALGAAPSLPRRPAQGAALPTLRDLKITFDQVKGCAEFRWSGVDSEGEVFGVVRPVNAELLSWEVEKGGQREVITSGRHTQSVRARLQHWMKEFPTNRNTICAEWILLDPDSRKSVLKPESPFDPDEDVFGWIEETIVMMAEVLARRSSPLGRIMAAEAGASIADFERYRSRMSRKEERRAEEEQRRREAMARLAEERRRREAERATARKAAEAERAAEMAKKARPAHARERPPLPPVSASFETAPLTFQDTVFPLPDLRGFFLRERAALWWVSNQSDDLLCLPYCRIEQLEHQLRTALRVLGPLRGRALLSDEVGLGKTIEAGLIIKELLTRGMVKRFLVLTVPSLVDQWHEELDEKFGLSTVTTNHADARTDPQQFWTGSSAIVASLHTLKQPAQLEIARQVQWDILVVDEAHYLRNRESQAWQAVNGLPRQFLLLLTATPVQNSIEELYNLVTLLQPGQLPTPREFRARFINPKRPREPREPEELRRLLGQVMIRNTRANAGLKLPPRYAETVLFQPDEVEREFWQHWEGELRRQLAQMKPGQSSLWGRLLLQTAGSSPAAWQSALEKFPDSNAARAWRRQAPLEASWRRKCALIPPLTRSEGGAVIFTQFLHTQSSLADSLRGAGVEAFVVNGATPAAERQPITEEFKRRGGALLLTHSGAEGRNLQFCHHLVNFDLPWNPMEIEQRIGRLHRLGQQQPVRIHNFVQAGTLQEHLLQILQEKLNLFELVVGETGLVLGERFSSDEFAEEVYRRWIENEGRVAEAIAGLGEELAAGRDAYAEVKKLDEILFTQNYESL
jgi:superfamily II DNA or RNA helicase